MDLAEEFKQKSETRLRALQIFGLSEADISRPEQGQVEAARLAIKNFFSAFRSCMNAKAREEKSVIIVPESAFDERTFASDTGSEGLRHDEISKNAAEAFSDRCASWARESPSNYLWKESISVKEPFNMWEVHYPGMSISPPVAVDA